jgi:hypothetical protein
MRDARCESDNKTAARTKRQVNNTARMACFASAHVHDNCNEPHLFDSHAKNEHGCEDMSTSRDRRAGRLARTANSGVLVERVDHCLQDEYALLLKATNVTFVSDPAYARGSQPDRGILARTSASTESIADSRAVDMT